jgi:hypothetical protein
MTVRDGTAAADRTRVVRFPVFGRPGGPARFGIGVAVLVTLITLAITVARLDLRLGTLVALNQETLDGARHIARADDRLTRRLHQLDALAAGAHDTLEQTRALQPVLAELRDAISPAATAVTTGRNGGERSAVQLAHIRDILLRLKTSTGQLDRSTSALDRQSTVLLGILDGLVDDLRDSLQAAERIDTTLPLPRTGGP